MEITFDDQLIASVPLKDPLQAFVVSLRRHVRRNNLSVDVFKVKRDDRHVIYIVGRTLGVT